MGVFRGDLADAGTLVQRLGRPTQREQDSILYPPFLWNGFLSRDASWRMLHITRRLWQ
jgi:hypothetical protein